MIDLISIHIPKTAGTSFYDILQQVFPQGLSPSYRRRDLDPEYGIAARPEYPSLRVVHGHFTWREVQAEYVPGHTRVITWLRDPVDRVISNYLFFQDRLQHPHHNPEIARLNAHRSQETLLEYALREENQNRICYFLEGLSLEQFFFIGFMESFDQDVRRLGELLGWPRFNIRQLNAGSQSIQATIAERERIRALNRDDCQLYDQARNLFRPSPLNQLQK